jgi:hypothetical protein
LGLSEAVARYRLRWILRFDDRRLNLILRGSCGRRRIAHPPPTSIGGGLGILRLLRQKHAGSG